MAIYRQSKPFSQSIAWCSIELSRLRDESKMMPMVKFAKDLAGQSIGEMLISHDFKRRN